MKPLSIRDLLSNRTRPLLSFEFFPPKDEAGLSALKQAAEKLLAVNPDFVTVTYGAGGSTREKTLLICGLLRDMGFPVVMPHLTCVGASREEMRAIVDRISGDGYGNIMALRGDPPQGETVFQASADGFSHASELVALIKADHPDMVCGIAGYPETHPEAPSAEEDLRNLKIKVEAGGDFITTQLFFDNRLYLDFVDRCRTMGITIPILPGLLPAISLQQARRMTDRCRTALPHELVRRMEQAGGSGPQAETVGIRWAARQAEDLLKNGAPGIHLYVLNRARAALDPELIGCIRQFRG